MYDATWRNQYKEEDCFVNDSLHIQIIQYKHDKKLSNDRENSFKFGPKLYNSRKNEKC